VSLGSREAQRRLLRQINPDAGRIVWINRGGNINPEVHSEAIQPTAGASV